jgi:hypothetical protein
LIKKIKIKIHKKEKKKKKREIKKEDRISIEGITNS